MRQSSTTSRQGRTTRTPAKPTAVVQFRAPARPQSPRPPLSPRSQPVTATQVVSYATPRNGIDWNDVTSQVTRQVRRRLKSNPRLPNGWIQSKVVTHVLLNTAGQLLGQKGDQGLPIPAVVREQTAKFFSAIPDMRTETDQWAPRRVKTLTGA